MTRRYADKRFGLSVAVALLVCAISAVAHAQPKATSDAPEKATAQKATEKTAAQKALERRFVALETLARKTPDQAERRLRKAKLPEVLTLRIRGVIALSRGKIDKARVAFEKAVAASRRKDPRLQLYLAHCHLALGRYDDALTALKKTQSLAKRVMARGLLLARALIAKKQLNEAYRVLRAIASRFAKSARPAVELAALCQRLKMRTEARRWAKAALARGLNGDEALALTQLLHLDRKAAPLLETLVAMFPKDATLISHLAYAYAAWERSYAAAKLFERAVDLGGDFAFEAADQFRLAGRYDRALRLNGRVSKRSRRLEQRLAIVVGAGAMGRVLALAETLKKLGQWDDATRYRVAYAHFALGQADQAATILRGLLAGPYGKAARSMLSVLGRAEKPKGTP
jgi:tetratricopeptide (TPR) repeat protein